MALRRPIVMSATWSFSGAKRTQREHRLSVAIDPSATQFKIFAMQIDRFALFRWS